MSIKLCEESLKSLESYSAYDHAKSLSELADNRYFPLERKPRFHGYVVSHSVANKLQITDERLDSCCIQQTAYVPLDTVVITHIRASQDVLLNGRYVNHGVFHLCSGRAFHAVARSPVHALAITLDKDHFLECFGEFTS